jgi:hypothetical protein
MRRLIVLPTLAASSFVMGAVLASAVYAQSSSTPPASAPSAADATADALKKAATGATANPAAAVKPTAATPAADAAAAAAAAPKPSPLAKAKALLPWNKTKAAKAAAPGDAAPTDATKAAPAKAATATASPAKVPAPNPADAPKAEGTTAAEPAKPVAKSAAAKNPVNTKAGGTSVPVKGASGEVMSGPMAATHAFFGANSYAAPTPSKTGVRPGCTRLAHSSIDVGKDNPIKFSREGIDNQIASLSKAKGWKATAKSDEKVICTEYVNLGLFGQEYTCRVEATVCPK